jgi:WD repeat-containing protein 81
MMAHSDLFLSCHFVLSNSIFQFNGLFNFSCRNWPPPQPSVLRGHTDGVSGFSVWGQDIISISRNKIGLSTLSRSTEEVR